MTAEMTGVSLGAAVINGLAAVRHAVIVASVRLNDMRCALPTSGLALQHGDGGGDTLQRHHGKREQQDEFSANDGHDGREV